VVGLLVVSIGVVPAVWSYLNYARAEAGESITGSLPDKWIIEEAKKKLEQKRERLLEYWAIVYRVKAKIDKIDESLKNSKDNLAKNEQILKGLNDLLKNNQPGSVIIIGGAKHDRDSVENDALSLVSACEVLRNQISGNEQSLSMLRQSYDDGKKAISDAQNDICQLEAQLGMDAVKLAIAGAQREAKLISSQVYSAGKGIADVRSDVYSEELTRRLTKVDAEHEWEEQFGSGKKPKTNWEKELGLAEKTTSKIDSYFKNSPSASATK